MAAVPDALAGAHVNVRDPTRGALFVRGGPSVRDHDQFVVRPHGRGLISDEDDKSHTTLPLRRVAEESKGGRLHRLRWVVGAEREAL